MAIDQTRSWTASIIERAKSILTRPKEAWPEIDRDMTPSGELFTRYAAPLAALAPVIGFLAGRLGWNPFSGHMIGQVFTAGMGYALSLGSLLVMSIVASKLAPRFGGTGSPRDAFKLIAYSSTAAWLASAAAAIPGFGFLGIASLYSLYLYFTGIGPMMKVPEENRKRFGFVTIACAIALNLVASTIANGPAMMFGGSPQRAIEQEQDIRINGEDIDFDPAQLRDLGEEIRKAVGDGRINSVPAASLEALLPASIGSYERTAIESARSDGPGGSHAEATYEDGNQAFTLKVVDLAGFGGFSSMFRIEKNRQDEDGFERVSSKDGAFTVEKWDNGGDEGQYVTIVDKRFLIEAEGEADSIEELKQAVSNVDRSKLTALAKPADPAP